MLEVLIFNFYIFNFVESLIYCVGNFVGIMCGNL